jgi:lysophospholipase L1-like esterase
MKPSKFLRYTILKLLILCLALTAFVSLQQEHTLYVIGDSTVRNKGGEGETAQWGWGSFIGEYFDSTKLKVNNQAMAGRSTRTFLSEGRWDKVMSMLKPGDFVIMQFGHNDGSRPDTSRAGYRGTLRGTGEDTVSLVHSNGRKETVHTYGWYLRKFIKDTKSKGATAVVCSMIPRNQWKDGKTLRASETFGKWAEEVARQEGAYFIDLNKITGDKYDEMGPEKVKAFFPGDHTHTNEAGARLNAASVAEGIKQLGDTPLKKLLKE